MNLSFDQEYRYIVFEPVHTVRSQLKSIIKTPWYDIAINLAGRLHDDNTFRLQSKMSIGIKVFGLIQDFAVITGRLETNNAQTHIHIKIGPPGIVVAAFYLIVLITLFEVVSMFIPNYHGNWIVAAGLFLLLIFIRSLIHFSIGRLKNRFERIMLLHPEEQPTAKI